MSPAVRAVCPDLGFRVAGARLPAFAAVPTLVFQVEISRDGGGPVRSVLLSTAIRIAPARRRYDPATRKRLAELFGAPERWADTLRPCPWTQVTAVVPPFEDRTVLDLAVPCPCGVELAATKYLGAVRDGEVPLDFLFSGTVFHDGADGRLHTAQISWSSDAVFGLPAALWHRATGGRTWIRLSRDSRDRLDTHRVRLALSDWDEVVGALLDQAAPATGNTPAATGNTPATEAGPPARTAGEACTPQPTL